MTMEQTNNIFSGAHLLKMGYPKGKVIGIALEIAKAHFPGYDLESVSDTFQKVLSKPDNYLTDDVLSPVAQELTMPKETVRPLRDTPDPYKVYGIDGIEQGAINQMEMAMRLPVARAGALMPDAHQGYGLPIGGVLATENAIIPYGVGVDIGCRMCMTIYEIPETTLSERKEDLVKILHRNTKFGRATFKNPKDHEVLTSPLFKEIKVVKDLREKAISQIGSSGGGNHFVEFGVTELLGENDFHLPTGKYLAVLSHSGSRGFGAGIAQHYTRLAMELCKLPPVARHLAWLDLDTQEGQEYWLAMNLAGEYASACHHLIHEGIAIGLRASPVVMIENHHNFAWKEKDSVGNEIIVHRKGATPAGKDVLGIIPGSVTAPGYIVRGKGDVASINSASHGAGRAMSRTQAKNTLDAKAVKDHIQNAGVELIGSGLDEAPMAYKDINKVMEAQSDLVEVVGSFTPKIVRMCGDDYFKEVD